MKELPYTQSIIDKICAIIDQETLGIEHPEILNAEFQAGARAFKEQILKKIKDAEL